MNRLKCAVKFLGGMVIILLLWSCAGDRYEQKTEDIKTNVQSFYAHIEAGEPDQAVFANQQIESVALESEEYLLRRVGQMSQGDRTREWKVIKTAKQTAAENWLALARYYLQSSDYQRARGTYQRLMETYKDPLYQSYVERAMTGLRDVNLILSPGETGESDRQ